MDLRGLAAVAALTSSGLFAGYTWARSHAAIPCITRALTSAKDEAALLAAWRTQYLCGFYISRPLCAINLVGYLYLAFTSPSNSTKPSLPTAAHGLVRLAPTLYMIAALSSASGVPYALTFLRRTNGALSIRAKRLAGPGEDPTAMALTYASHERRSLEREGAKEWADSRVLVGRWCWHNWVRTGILVLGTVIGAVGVVVDGW